MSHLPRVILALVLSAAALAIGVGVLVGSADGSPHGGSATRSLSTSMFAAKHVERAIKQFKAHIGSSVKLLDLELTATAARFAYVVRGRGGNYTVTIPGTRPPPGATLILQGPRFYDFALLRFTRLFRRR